jgi:hypothetical protein
MGGCADVCLDHYYEDGNDFYSEAVVVARKPHACCECGETITPGQQYERATGKSEGEVWTAKSCKECREIRKAFVCGGWVFGHLWESIEEGMFPAWDTAGPIDCLAKLDSVEARDKCRDRYRQWKEDQR